MQPATAEPALKLVVTQKCNEIPLTNLSRLELNLEIILEESCRPFAYISLFSVNGIWNFTSENLRRDLREFIGVNVIVVEVLK